MSEPIRILIVDASVVDRRKMRDIFSGADDLVVVGEAATPATAQDLAKQLLPDVIIVRNSVSLDAYEVSATIMSTAAAPIIVVAPGQHADRGPLRATEAGAVAFVELPEADCSTQRKAAAEIVYLVRVMAEVKVVRRNSRSLISKETEIAAPPPPVRAAGLVDVVAIGASTGGPQVLYKVLSSLPVDFPVPILIVQHFASGFQRTLIDYLNSAGPLTVRPPVGGESLIPGTVYVAPDEKHLGVDRRRRAVLSDAPPENGLRPAVSFLFRSVGIAYGKRCVGVLLSGMGRDGADELFGLHEAGAITIAQDEQSSVVFGMAKEALALGGVTHTLGINQIAPAIVALTRNSQAN